MNRGCALLPTHSPSKQENIYSTIYMVFDAADFKNNVCCFFRSKLCALHVTDGTCSSSLFFFLFGAKTGKKRIIHFSRTASRLSLEEKKKVNVLPGLL